MKADVGGEGGFATHPYRTGCKIDVNSAYKVYSRGKRISGLGLLVAR